MESILLFAAVVLLIAALLSLEFLHFKERHELLNRVQARSLPEFVAAEVKEAQKGEEKKPTEHPGFL